MDMGASPSPTTGAAGAMPEMGGGLMAEEPVPTEGAVPATETMGLQPMPFTAEDLIADLDRALHAGSS